MAVRVVPIADPPLLVYLDQQTYSKTSRAEKRARLGLIASFAAGRRPVEVYWQVAV